MYYRSNSDYMIYIIVSAQYGGIREANKDPVCDIVIAILSSKNEKAGIETHCQLYLCLQDWEEEGHRDTPSIWPIRTNSDFHPP